MSRARSSDPSTSHAAGAAVELIEVIRRRVYTIHREHAEGLTDDELAKFYRDRYHADGFQAGVWSSARKRRSDLKNMGMLEDSGLRRRGVSGRQMIVWRITKKVEMTAAEKLAKEIQDAEAELAKLKEPVKAKAAKVAPVKAARRELAPVPIVEWPGCYDEGWKDVITPESFAHPAKAAKGLLTRIFDHLFSIGALKKNDIVGDPFGGVGTTGLMAAYRGLRAVSVELEPKFYEMSLANIEKHRHKWEALRLPVPVFLNGDSRKFRTLVAENMEAVVSSPPYAAGGQSNSAKSFDAQQSNADAKENFPGWKTGAHEWVRAYGTEPGQLGTLKEGDVDAVVSSPPYVGALSKANTYADDDKREAANARDIVQGRAEIYGQTEGQLGAMRGGTVDAIVSSPPYAETAIGDLGNYKGPAYLPKDCGGLFKAAGGTDTNYGKTEGQLGGLKDTGVDAIISSPPYAETALSGGGGIAHEMRGTYRDGQNYGDDPAQVGAMAEGEGVDAVLVDVVVSSPPYSDQGLLGGDQGNAIGKGQRSDGRTITNGLVGDPDYGQTEGQLGELPTGDVDVIVSSPPYTEEVVHGRPSKMTEGIFKGRTASTGLGAYGDQPGQLGAMNAGDVDAIVSSPPYAEIASGAGGLNSLPPRNAEDTHGRTATAPSQDTDKRYGDADGQLAKLPKTDVDVVISSPPFLHARSDTERSIATPGKSGPAVDRVDDTTSGCGYGTTDGNLDNLPPAEGVDAVISSPPYADGGVHGTSTDVDRRETEGPTRADGTPLGLGRSGATGYGEADGQLGAMPSADGVDAVVSSPPYAETLLNDAQREAGKGLPLRWGTNEEYGTTEGQLGTLKDGEGVDVAIDGVVTSPPYENILRANHSPGPAALRAVGDDQTMSYGKVEGNVGNSSGDTFWSASKTIVGECYAALKPGGYAVWIVKAFVRNKQIVDFPGDWRRLCEHMGFETVTEVRALLVKESRELDLFGNEIVTKVERKSFFRRLHESKSPETAINHEVLWVMRKPL